MVTELEVGLIPAQTRKSTQATQASGKLCAARPSVGNPNAQQTDVTTLVAAGGALIG